MKKVKNIFVSILVLLVAVLSFGTVLITHSHESVVNAGSGVYVEDGGEFNATGGVIKDNAKGAITINGGTHTIENVVFDGNLETAINVRGGVLNLVNCRITNNLSSSNGGAINVASGATLNLKGTTTITGNSAINGGAIYAAAGSTVNISGKLNIQNNTATSYGGAIFAAGAVNIAANFTGSIKGNTANIGADGYMNAGTLDVNSNASGFYFVTMAGTATTNSPKIIPNVDGVQNESIFATNTLDYNYINSALTGVATEENSCGWFSDETFVNGYTNTGVTTKLTADKTLYTKMATLDKLAFTVANGEVSVKAKDSSITGSVVIPRKYNGTLVTNVAASGFKSTKVTTVTLSNSINKLNANSYDGCSTLTTINLLNGITEIPTYAFINCSALESISIPNSVTTMKNYAFYGCSKLKKVNINSVEKWCNITFSDWHANPLPFAGNLYLNNSLVENLVIPETITTIKPQTFRQCSSIKTVTMANSVTKIENSAFFGCANLKNITLSNNITVIENHALRNCKSLTEINIPSSVTTIGSQAFDGCASLTKVNITDLAKWCNIDFNYYSSNPLYYAHSLYLNGTKVTNLVIPNDITKIKKYAFYNGSFVSVTISNGVTDIEKNAFAGCSSLTTITIPNSVTIINTDAFAGCSKLVNITTPILDAKFSNMFGTQATTVTLTKGTSIPDNYFKDCENLTSLTIPNSVTSIGNSVFYGCTSLTTITIPSSVTSIGDMAFYNCSSLTRVDIADLTAWCNINFGGFSSNPLEYAQDLYLNGSKITDLVIPSDVTKIKYRAFEGGSFVSVTIPDSVTSISERAFTWCKSLERVDITDLTKWCNIDFHYNASNPLEYAHDLYLNGALITDLVIPNGVTQLKNNVFAGAFIESVIIPDSVTSIGSSAFEECWPLTDITIPDSVTSIGYSAFEDCRSLRGITIPNSVTSIGSSAFYDCSDLANVTTPILGTSFSSIFGSQATTVTLTKGTSIPDNYFKDCSNLFNITLPDELTNIGTNAFQNCSSLTEVNITDLTAWCNINFGGFYSNPLHYAHHLYLNGSKITDLVIPSDVTKINGYAFHGGSFVSVTIPNGVTSIGSSAFEYCRSLTTITIPNSVTSIHTDAFASCVKLVNITTPILGTKFSTIFGAQATAVTLTKGTSIPNDYFKDCSNLFNITLPDELTNIGTNAFQNCSSLTKVNITDITKWCNIDFAHAYSNPLYYAHDLYLNGTKVTNLVIPDGITRIEDNTFVGGSFTSVKIPNSMNEISSVAFTGCSNLVNVTTPHINDSIKQMFGTNIETLTLTSGETITVSYVADLSKLKTLVLPTSVTKIVQYAFTSCPSLTNVTTPAYSNILLFADIFGNNVTDLTFIGSSVPDYLVKDYAALRNLTISESIKTIGKESFSGSGVTNVTIKTTGNLAIGNSSFINCTSLKNVNFLTSSTTTTLDEGAFNGCTALETINLPAVTSIGNFAFNNCTSLGALTLPTTLKTIGNYAFKDTTALNTITIPASVETIGTAAFSKSGLKTVVFENGTTAIALGIDLFHTCANLSSVTLGNRVTSMPQSMFYACTSLTSFEIPSTVTNLGVKLFRKCSNLATVTFASGSTITIIPAQMFSECTKLTSVNLPSIVTEFAEMTDKDVTAAKTFENCTSLINITIPSSVTTIGGYTFYGCSRLASVTIPNSVKTIKDYAFQGCYGLTKVNINSIENWCDINFSDWHANPLPFAGNLYLNNSLVENLVIPETVTTIKPQAFRQCSSIKTVTMANSVTKLENAAFFGCANLKSVTLSDGMKVIGASVFRNCKSLLEITIPSKVTTIEDNAFNGCTSFSEITIPNNVTSIGYGAFSGCSNLLNITAPIFTKTARFLTVFGPQTTSVNLTSGSSIPESYFEKCTNLQTITLTSSITNIGPRAFYGCSSLTNVALPNNLTSIGSSAFGDCLSLTNITIPSSVTSIGSNAFVSCSSLTKVNITDLAKWCNISFYDEYSNPLNYAHDLYLNDAKITDLVIPSSITSIRQYVFVGGSFVSVTIPNNVTRIGHTAFGDCQSLTRVDITDLTAWCNIDFIYYSSNPLFYAHDLYLNGALITNLVIPNGVTQINRHAFNGGSFTNAVISNSVSSIDGTAFNGCSNLVNVTTPHINDSIKQMFGTNIEALTLTSGETITESYVAGLSKLKTLVLPTSVTKIVQYAFTSCPSLTNVTTPAYSNVILFADIFGNNVTDLTFIGSSVPDYFVKDYAALRNLTISESIKTIGKESFSGSGVTNVTIKTTGNLAIGNSSFINCTSLKNVNFLTSSTVTTLDEGAFNGCTALETINLPAVTSIGNFAFNNCTSLGALTLPTTLKTIGNYAFKDTTALNTITIPASVETIGTAAFSKSGLKTVVFENGTTTIALGIDLFHTCANLSSVTLGNRVKSMPQSMFYACTSLTSFEIPSTVTNLGVKLFRKCSNLATVTFASGSLVTIIPAQMFSECTKLSSVSFPSTITEFAEMTDKDVTAAKTFENCTSLISISLPNPLYTIGGQAFIGCTALRSITLPINLCNIGSKVFSGCTNLSNVTMKNTGNWLLTGTNADGVGVSTTLNIGTNGSTNATYFKTTYVEYVWKKVIENINKFNYELNSDGTYTVIDNGCSGEVVIPSTYNGRNVTKILAEGFKDNKRITKITIPSTIKYIGEKAFSGCWNLKNVTFDGGGKEWVLTNPENNNVVYMTVDASGKDSWYSNNDTSANIPIPLYSRLTSDPYRSYVWTR